ncbi:MAG TPA: hypothetical protein VKK31_13470 [Thermoanaerobaculia bacterium]|nr:hypothetical protein [Thermoanaerobaculia bacterium]
MATIEEKKAVARALVRSKYPTNNPDINIRSTLDEPVEEIATADFYNGPGARWVMLNTPFLWAHLNHQELGSVQTIRDFGKICFAHLADRSELFELEIFED